MSLYTDAIVVSIDGVVIVVLMVTLGALATRYNILTPEASASLGELTFTILLPSLLFTEIMKSLSISNAYTYASLFLFALTHIFLGSCLGWVLGKISHANVATVRLMMISIGFQETTAIPLVLASVLGTNPTIKKTKHFSNDAISVVLIYTVFCTLFKWTYAYWYCLSRLVKKDITVKTQNMEKEPQNLLMIEEKPQKKGMCWTIKQTLNPPIYASMLAAPLALIPYMQKYVFCDPDSVFGNNLFSALEILGSTVSPLICMLLGTKLSKGYPESATISNLNVFFIILGKLVVMPLIGFGLCMVFYRIGVIDRLVALMVMVMYATPTSKQMLMVCKDDKMQLDNLSKVFLFMYLVVLVPMAAWTMLFIVVLYG